MYFISRYLLFISENFSPATTVKCTSQYSNTSIHSKQIVISIITTDVLCVLLSRFTLTNYMFIAVIMLL